LTGRANARSHVAAMFFALGLTATAACGGGEASQPLSCATDATPDLSVSSQFSVDTGITTSSNAGAGYGQRACPDAFLVEVDLGPTQSPPDFFVSGGWSTTIPAQPCDETSSMTVFAREADQWRVWDVVVYQAQAEGPLCHAQAVSHTNASATGLGGALIPSNSGVQTVRVAVMATQEGSKVPVYLAGE